MPELPVKNERDDWRVTPTPRPCPDLNLSNYIYGTRPLNWSNWQKLHGGGVCSWFRWFGCWITLQGPSEEEMNQFCHQELLDQRQCHYYGTMIWCCCKPGVIYSGPRHLGHYYDQREKTMRRLMEKHKRSLGILKAYEEGWTCAGCGRGPTSTPRVFPSPHADDTNVCVDCAH